MTLREGGLPGASASGRVDWPAVALFYFLACAFSWPFFWWRDLEPARWAAWQAPGLLKTATYMWGPGLAALVCRVIFRRRHPRRITLAGTLLGRSAAFYLVPLAALAALGGSGEGWRGHGLPLLVAVASFATVFGEELGWRGFLQDALQPLSPVRRWILIGALWEFWHFTNRVHDGPALAIAVRLLISYPVVMVLAWLIGTAVERSRSLLVAHTLHLWVNLLFEIGTWQAAAVFAASLGWWVWLLRSWPAPAPLPEPEAPPQALPAG